MPAQRRMNMNDALVIDKLAFTGRRDSLGSELLDRVVETPEAVAAIGKGKLGYNYDPQHYDQKFALHE
jgi:hypothetical protein